MAAIAISLFIGVSWLAVQMHARPSETASVLSQIAHASFPTGPMYYIVQGFTLAILILAANSSYQGFPRLAALLARDRFFPRQFVNLGDRLVYSNGIVLVAALASALIVIFAANVESLLHLYVVGVFTAFTLSQTGWCATGDARATAAGSGARRSTASAPRRRGLVTLVVIETKFTEGAWAVMVAIPLWSSPSTGRERHYRRVGRRLRAGVSAVAAAPPATNEVVLYVDSFDAALREALWYARRDRERRLPRDPAPGERTDPGLRARFRELTDMRPGPRGAAGAATAASRR